MKIKLNSDLDQFWVNKIVFLIPSLCLIIPIQPQKNNFNMVEQYFRHCQYLWRDKFCIERNQFWKRRCFWHKLHYLFKNMWQKVNDPISCFKGHCAMLFPHTKFMMHLTVEALRPTTSDLPRAWVFQQLPWRGLNGYFITKTSLLLFNIWETAFNLWKQVLLRRLFTYGYHDNMREQQLRLENASFSPGCTLWQKTMST